MAKNLGDMGGLVRQAQKMQAELRRIQEDLKDRVIEGKAGGDAVVAYVNGAQELLQVKIKPEVVDPGDVEDLEDMIVAAVRSAMEESRKMAEAETSRVTGGLGGGLL
jgi:hypothetical protein